ncbi:hypothetical protein [Streptomyces sp. NPDC057682]|uniref:hypothetical protein n=1 Tax=Streptomyces sp. NPDC057682 TaxID=3346210 RepID=UPI00368C9A33
MDIGEIAQRSIEIVVAQGSAAIGDLVFNALSARPEGEPAAVALRDRPDDSAAQEAASGVLERILEENQVLARMFQTELEKLEPSHVTAVGFGSGHTVVTQQTGKGNRSHVGDVNNRTTKHGGAFWGIVAAVVVVIGAGSTLLVVQNESEPTLQEQAEKTALDFTRASFGGDFVTMCGLRAKELDMEGCESAEGMESSQAEADEAKADIERSGIAKNWTVSDSRFPSDNRAIISLKHDSPRRSVVVDMTHDTGAWRVVKVQRGE